MNLGFNNNARIICLHCLFWDCLQFPFRIRASFMKRKIAASFLSESQFHHSPCFPKLMKTISKKSHRPLGSDWWITFEMNKWTILKKSNKIVVMKWRHHRSDEMKGTGPPGKQSRALQSCWRWSPLWRPTTKKMFWWRFFRRRRQAKGERLKTWRRSQLFWSSTASTGKLLWPLKRRNHMLP